MMIIIYILIIIGNLSLFSYLYKFVVKGQGIFTFPEWLQIKTSVSFSAYMYASFFMAICHLLGIFLWYLLLKSAINASVPVSCEKIRVSMLSLVCGLFFISIPVATGGWALNDAAHCLGFMCSYYTFYITNKLWYYTFSSESDLYWSLMLLTVLFIIQVVVFLVFICFIHLIVIKFMYIGYIPFIYEFNLALVAALAYVYDFYVRVQVLIYQLPPEYPRLRSSKKLFNFLDAGAGVVLSRSIFWFVILSSVDWNIYI